MTGSPSLDPAQTVDQRIPAYLGRVLGSDGEAVGTCFQTAPGVLVTACHVVDDLSAGNIGSLVSVDSLAGGIAAFRAHVVQIDREHDLAVLQAQNALTGTVAGWVATDDVGLGVPVVVTGVSMVDDPGHEYRYLDTVGTWSGGTIRDGSVSLGRAVLTAVMSGGPIRRKEDDHVVGIVSNRYNSFDGWARDTAWIARTEDLEPLLCAVSPIKLPGPRSTLSNLASELLNIGNLPELRIIAPDPSAARNWKAVLDGSPLSPNMASVDAIVPRYITMPGQTLDESQFLDWLTRHPGEAILLRGAAGEGKSSFLNRLSAKSLHSHVFLRHTANAQLPIGNIESFRRELQNICPSRKVNATPTIVVVVSLDFGSEASRDTQLVNDLRRRQIDDGAVTIIIDGRPGPIDRLKRRVSATVVELAPLDRTGARRWVAVYRRALKFAIESGMNEAAVALRWPNLLPFLSISNERQDNILLDSTAPMIVRGLRAVYGETMWKTLVDELERLDDVDKSAYLQVCLTTMAGHDLSEQTLEDLFPDAAIDDRSNHDPWIQRSGCHFARHPIIAEIVLSASSSRRAIISAVNQHIGRLEFHQEDRAILLSLSSILSSLPTATAGTKLKGYLTQSLRQGFLGIDDPISMFVDASESAEEILQWALAIRALIPNDGHKGRGRAGRSDDANRLRSIASSLFQEASRSEHLRWPEQAHYAADDLILTVAEIDSDITCDAIRGFVVKYIQCVDAPWWTRRDQAALYRWTTRGIDMLPKWNLDGDCLEAARIMYPVLFKSWQGLRMSYTQAELVERRLDIYPYAATMAYEHMPSDILMLLQNAIRESICLGVVDSQLCLIYSESVLSNSCLPRQASHVLARQAVDNLSTALLADQYHAEIFLHIALLESKFDVRSKVDWLTMLRNSQYSDSAINRAYVKHTSALAGDSDGPDQRMGDITAALRDYSLYATDKWKFSRIELMWRFAVNYLHELTDNTAAAQRQYYERRRKYEFVP